MRQTMEDKVCINCIHKEVCYMYRLTYISDREGYCTNYYEEPKKGKWIEKVERRGCFAGDKTVYSYTCPFCGAKEFNKYPFCYCGADMREDTNEI